MKPENLSNRVQGATALGALALGAGLTAAPGAQAAVVITDINQTLVDPAAGMSAFLDLDLVNVATRQPGMDGVIDFGLGIFSNANGTATKAAVVGADNLDLKLNINRGTKKGFAQLFNGGQSVPGDAINGSGPFAALYADVIGAWAQSGVTGFVGLEFVFTDGFGTPDTSHFGWLEITRGSLIVGQFGFQTTPGAPAPIPLTAVPLPAAAWLFLTGVAGLFGLGVRRKTKSSVSEPAGLAQLATGASGLLALRSHKEA